MLIEAAAPERRDPIPAPAKPKRRPSDDAHVGMMFVTLVIVGIALGLAAFMFAARWFFSGTPF